MVLEYPCDGGGKWTVDYSNLWAYYSYNLQDWGNEKFPSLIRSGLTSLEKWKSLRRYTLRYNRFSCELVNDPKKRCGCINETHSRW